MPPTLTDTVAQNSLSNFSTTLLITIFESVCNYEPVHLPLSPTHPRHVLNLVCKTWHNVVRSTVSLWADIYFAKPSSDEAHQRHPILKQLAFCVKLSGQSPLTIAFDTVFDAWTFSIVSAVIIPHAHRIKSLSCLVHGKDNVFAFLTSGGGQFIVLEYVDICFANTKHTPISSFPLEDWLLFTGFRDAPRLHKAIFRLANGLHPLDLHLPWAQLTSLDLGSTPMTPEVFIKILHSTTLSLENGFFCVRFSKPYHPGLMLSRHVVSMHALRTLRLLLFFPSQDTRLFSLLCFPVLQGLWVQMHDFFQDWEIPLYTKLVKCSKKTLRDLRLQDYPPHSNENSGFVVRRRRRDTTSHTLEKLFKAIPNVDKVYLPTGLYIHNTTLVKMRSYSLLPKISFLEVSALDAWPILAMARRRHELFMEAAIFDESDLETGSQEPIILLGPPTTVRMLIPRGYPAEEKMVLVKEAQVLGMLGIACTILSTDMLPLPVVDHREIMRSTLLAWVKGVPQEHLMI